MVRTHRNLSISIIFRSHTHERLATVWNQFPCFRKRREFFSVEILRSFLRGLFPRPNFDSEIQGPITFAHKNTLNKTVTMNNPIDQTTRPCDGIWAAYQQSKEDYDLAHSFVQGQRAAPSRAAVDLTFQDCDAANEHNEDAVPSLETEPFVHPVVNGTGIFRGDLVELLQDDPSAEVVYRWDDESACFKAEKVAAPIAPAIENHVIVASPEGDLHWDYGLLGDTRAQVSVWGSNDDDDPMVEDPNSPAAADWFPTASSFS